MTQNIYTTQGTEITWTVPSPCPHSEVAFNEAESWCEMCGAVLGEARGCDWQGCGRPVVSFVRVDIPRGNSFTSLMWWRCGEHTPNARDGATVLPYDPAATSVR